MNALDLCASVARDNRVKQTFLDSDALQTTFRVFVARFLVLSIKPSAQVLRVCSKAMQFLTALLVIVRLVI